MFYHLKIILRNLRRNFTYSAINIAGLSIGITASVLIFLWVHHERSFDTCYPDTERIFRITNMITENKWVFDNSSLPFIQACKDEIPEIENIAIKYDILVEAIKVNNTFFSVKENAAYVDKSWLKMFHSQLIDGSFEAFDNHPFSVAITESGAKKFFGNKQAIGQIISINHTDYMVRTVVKDNPSNSSFRHQIMVSTNAFLSDPQQRKDFEMWGWNTWMTFAKLRPNADVKQVTQKMNDILAKNNRNNMEASLRLITDIHFETDNPESSIIHGNGKAASVFALLGILLLSAACINYINLTTAKMTMRAREAGLKKIIGAKRKSLFMQFMIESFIISFAAAVVALCLMLTLSLQYQSLAGITLTFSTSMIWTITGITLLFVTILNGIYPALMLSSFQPVSFLKGMNFTNVKSSSLRRGLVIFQFALSAALIISITVIYIQMAFIQNMNPGYSKEHIIRVELPYNTLFSSGGDSALQSLQTIKEKLQTCPNIISVTLCNARIENNRNNIYESADWNGRAENFNPSLSMMKVDEDFITVFDLQLTDGYWFNGEKDMQNVILNETAIREFKIPEPYIGQRFDLLDMKGAVIGIVKDFHFRSLHEKITPFVLYRQNPYSRMLSIKTQAGKSAESIRELETIWNDFFPNEMLEYVFLDDAFNSLYQSDIRTSRLMLVFSILAVVIAALGLFGLSTFAIERRTKEIGIRKVLGASIPGIIHLLTREFFVLVAVAFVIAVPVAQWVMSKWLNNFAYRIHITVWIFIAGAMATLLIALLAIGIQVLMAATANPVKAIKTE